jgi:hypothetical protein
LRLPVEARRPGRPSYQAAPIPAARDKYRRGRRLDAGDVAVFSLDSKTIDRAWEALDPLSGTPKLLNDPLNGPVDGG